MHGRDVRRVLRLYILGASRTLPQAKMSFSVANSPEKAEIALPPLRATGLEGHLIILHSVLDTVSG